MKDTQLIACWNYINNNYKITHFKKFIFEGLCIVEIVIELNDSHSKINSIHSVGCHFDKKIALVKAIAELIERLVFSSIYVGPLEFFNLKPYVSTISGHYVPLSEISWFFANKEVVTSRGYASHFIENSALNNSINEFYETKVYENLALILEKSKLISKKVKLPVNMKKMSLKIINKLKFLIVKIMSNYFVLVYHPNYSKTVVGTSYSPIRDKAINSATFEAMALLDEMFKTKRFKPEKQLFTTFGYYVSSETFNAPLTIRRHHNILSNLGFYVYQSIDETYVQKF